MNEFYKQVPRTLAENLNFRERLLKQAAGSKQLQTDLKIMCKRDVLFYINTFCFTYDPRLDNEKSIPFITYPYQNRGIPIICDSISNNDLVIEKSRDMGASWMVLCAMDWQFLFQRGANFLMLSKKEDFVDQSGNPDCLFWKLDFMHSKLPGWLRPELERNRLRIRNMECDSSILGDSTTADSGRGGRYTAVLADEFAIVEEGEAVIAALAQATNSVIYNSTPKGQANAFYKKRQEAAAGLGGAKLLRMHWSEHPLKSIGIKFEQGKLTSEWYRRESSRLGHPKLVAQELDIDYLGSDYQFFDAEVLDRIDREIVREPYIRGDISYDSESLQVREFQERADGPLLLWTPLDAQRKPIVGNLVLGADIATGTGASNSVLVGADKKTGEKVLEYANPRINPEQFARYSIALAKWLDAFLIWEANGPGRQYGNQVLEIGYRKVFYRQNENKFLKKISDVPGWYSTKDTKCELLGRYRSALSTGEFIDRSKSSVEECRHYVFLPNGIVSHSGAAVTDDPTGASDNHGDRVIANALCCRVLKETQSQAAKADQVTPRDSFAYRREQFEDRRAEKKMSW